jgi:hypothetical protein
MKPVDRPVDASSIDPVLTAVQRYTVPVAFLSLLIALVVIGCAFILY